MGGMGSERISHLTENLAILFSVAWDSAANAYDKQATSRPKPGHPLNYGQAEI